jgi:hypothetical protein
MWSYGIVKKLLSMLSNKMSSCCLLRDTNMDCEYYYAKIKFLHPLIFLSSLKYFTTTFLMVASVNLLHIVIVQK